MQRLHFGLKIIYTHLFQSSVTDTFSSLL